ncbi:hypothetical protein [Synechococcus sp. N19]|uniref:hypothetical protein n=1 Tax=Synechococcus sp. N19 TaxID=2575512 RepID=UPI001A7E15BF|nr:hypothetical protein [Synechococcus sp. N19]
MRKGLFNLSGKQRNRANRIALLSLIIILTITSVFLFGANKIEYSRSQMNLDHVKEQQIISPDNYYTQHLIDLINRFRSSLKGEEESDWKPATTSVITISIEGIDRINEVEKTVHIRGFVNALYAKTSISTPYLSEGDLTKKAKEDILSIAEMKFVDAEQSKWERVSINDWGNDTTMSRYRFQGSFPLERDLSKFPFERASWKIKMSFPLSAASVYFDVRDLNINFPGSEVGAYIFDQKNCSNNSIEFMCVFNKVARVQPSKLEKTKGYERIREFQPLIGMEGFLRRSPGSGYFRHLFPVLTVCALLILIDQISNKNLIDIKIGAPPTIFLTLIFMQSSYQAQITQLTYLTYLDKIYIMGFLMSFLCLSSAILESRTFSNNVERRIRYKYMIIRQRIRFTTYSLFFLCPLIAWFV